MTRRVTAHHPAFGAPYGGKPAATDFSSVEARMADYLKSIQGRTVTGQYVNEPHTIVPTPRWQSQHDLLCRVLQGDRTGSMAKITGWSVRKMDRFDLMRLYVGFLADHQSPLAQQVKQILDEMSHSGNKRHRKPLREQAWNLCVGDASLRLPEWKP